MQKHLPKFKISNEDLAVAGPFFVLLYVIMAGGYVLVLFSTPSMREPGPLALFTGLMLAHGVLYWFSPYLAQNRRWFLICLLVQGGLVFAIGYLTQSWGLFLALYMALVGETAGILWPDRKAVALAAAFYTSLLFLNIIVLWGPSVLGELLLTIGVMLAFVLVYVVLYIRQVQAREEAQELLKELEVAHDQLQEYAEQVEELTISQERQRMARELHDTLAQGLAGLILQLEAVDSHLETGNPDRAQAVVQQAMKRARITLHEARRAIQALRPTALEQGNLIDALGHEIDQFAVTASVQATFEIDVAPSNVPSETAQDILRIVQEALSNVARHAQANHVLVRLATSENGFQVIVRDDGVGFDPTRALEKPGCFGLAGMHERAERNGGILNVESELGRGTTVTLQTTR